VNFPFPVLLCDIGGTNVRFAFQARPGMPLERAPAFKTHEHSGLDTVLSLLFPQLPARPRSMIACVAGPVAGRRVVMTNADWTIDGAHLAEHAGFAQGLLLNDFEAQALSLPVLRPDWILPIGSTPESSRGIQLIMGPGTGLGTAALVKVDSRYLALASEAGHMDLGPVSIEDTEIWRQIDSSPLGRISAETLLSGHGLIRLHRARCLAARQRPPKFDEVEITNQALANPDGEEAQSVRFFWRLVARFAGDLALAFLARGGVTFSGGILPRLTPLLDVEDFRAHFENKAPYTDLMRSIGTRLILANEYVLTGMAHLAEAPQNYSIDYASRTWCAVA
jgi:glucokinase